MSKQVEPCICPHFFNTHLAKPDAMSSRFLNFFCHPQRLNQVRVYLLPRGAQDLDVVPDNVIAIATTTQMLTMRSSLSGACAGGIDDLGD